MLGARMSEKEQWISLDQAATFSSGGTPSKANSDYWDGEIPWVSAKDMKTSRIFDVEDHISEAGLANGSSLAPAGATLVLVRGMTLLNDVPICLATRDVAFNQDVKALVPRDGVVGTYLHYAIHATKPTLLSAVDLAGHGTEKLPTDIFKSVQIRLPQEDEQRAVAHILGTLDDKIEVNRRMNETLEAMARAIFKSWFVDFDPVRAKASGEPEESICQRLGLTPGLMAHFPDAVSRSDAGSGPVGWDVGPLEAALVLQRGFDLPAPDKTPGLFPVLAASGPSGTHKDFMVRGPGVTTGRSGVLGKVYFVHGDFWPLNTSLWIKEFRRGTPAFAFYLLQGLDFAQYNSGSAVPTPNCNHIHGLPIFLPPPSLVQAFDEIAMTNLRQQKALEDELVALTELRNTLLPRLLSGDLSVSGENHSEELMHV